MRVGLTRFVIGLGGAGVLPQVTSGMLDPNQAAGAARFLNEIGHLLVFLAFPLAVVSLFVRRRRSDPVQGLQLRWFA